MHRIFAGALRVPFILAGVVFWIGWIVWGAFLLIPAMPHPRAAFAFELDRTRILLGLAGFALLLLTFTPTPSHENSLMNLLRP